MMTKAKAASILRFANGVPAGQQSRRGAAMVEFALFFMIFTRIFPIISIWEIREGRTTGLDELDERVRSYLPDQPDPAGAHAEGTAG